MRELLLKALEAAATSPEDLDDSQVLMRVVQAVGGDGWEEIKRTPLSNVLTVLTVGDLLNFATKMR